MSAGRADVSIEITGADPFAVIRCHRCGSSLALMQDEPIAAEDVARFAKSHGDCTGASHNGVAD